VDRVIDAEGLDGKMSPLSGIHVSIVPRVFFFLFCAEGLFVRFVLKVEAPFFAEGCLLRTF